MRNLKRIGSAFAIVASLAFCLPQSVWAAEPAMANATNDVMLRDNGLLVGKVVNADGAAQAGAAVSVRFEGKDLVTTSTDQEGYFAIKGLRGGMHQVVTAGGQGVFQLWAAGTAPPGAKEGALVVTNQVIRGQAPEGPGTKSFFNNPVVIAAIVATAVAVPIALTRTSE